MKDGWSLSEPQLRAQAPYRRLVDVYGHELTA